MLWWNFSQDIALWGQAIPYNRDVGYWPQLIEKVLEKLQKLVKISEM